MGGVGDYLREASNRGMAIIRGSTVSLYGDRLKRRSERRSSAKDHSYLNFEVLLSLQQ